MSDHRRRIDPNSDSCQEDSHVSRLSRALFQGIGRRIRCKQRSSQLDTLSWGRRYLPRHFHRQPSVMHCWLGQQLDDMHNQRGTKINVIGPRGGAKSTIGSLCYILRAALDAWEPYIWLVSDTKDQAQTHLENIKAELEGNPLLARDFPQATGRGARWRRGSMILPNGVVIEGFGTGQRLRGRRIRESRPSLIVCDDLQNDDHMASATLRESSTRWFHGTLLKAGTKHTNVLNLATALHRDALAMQLDRNPGWHSKKFKAILKWPTNDALWKRWETIYCDLSNHSARRDAWFFYVKNRKAMNEGAELLWPEEEDLYTLMKMCVEEGRSAFEREKQSSPIDPERCEWPDEYFGEHVWFQAWPEQMPRKVIALDPSKGVQSRQGDYSAFVVLGMDDRGVMYVEADLAKRHISQMVADGLTLCERHRVNTFGVEANQFQELLADEFRRECNTRGLRSLQVCSIHNTLNKQSRIRRLGALLSQRRLRFVQGSVSTTLLVDQLRDFPLGGHDDGPDALEMAVRLIGSVNQSIPDDGLGDRLAVG